MRRGAHHGGMQLRQLLSCVLVQVLERHHQHGRYNDRRRGRQPLARSLLPQLSHLLSVSEFQSVWRNPVTQTPGPKRRVRVEGWRPALYTRRAGRGATLDRTDGGRLNASPSMATVQRRLRRLVLHHTVLTARTRAHARDTVEGWRPALYTRRAGRGATLDQTAVLRRDDGAVTYEPKKEARPPRKWELPEGSLPERAARGQARPPFRAWRAAPPSATDDDDDERIPCCRRGARRRLALLCSVLRLRMFRSQTCSLFLAHGSLRCVFGCSCSLALPIPRHRLRRRLRRRRRRRHPFCYRRCRRHRRRHRPRLPRLRRRRFHLLHRPRLAFPGLVPHSPPDSRP